MAVNKDIWVLLEAEDGKLSPPSVALMEEGASLARECGGRLHGVYLGPAVEGLGREVGARGAIELHVCLDEALRQYDPFMYEHLLLGLLKARAPRLLLALSSSLGSDLLPRLAFKLGAPLVTNCADIDVAQDGELLFVRPVHNGRLFATVRATGEGPGMAIFLPQRLAIAGDVAAPEAEATITPIDRVPIRNVPPLKVTGFVKADHRTIDITEAEIIVAVGRGVGSKENLAAVASFADRIGAAIGGTRPMVDAGILPYERQIGQTGKRVAPKLIFLFGISGATEFVQGIANAGTSVAINIDPQSPVFKAVDLGIVGDLNALTPRILRHIGEAVARQA
jgi:electron transfer flavoprotein alpha subunit